MEREGGNGTDSQGFAGGVIPGLGGAAAFRLMAPAQSAIPVVIAVPHAGRAYPPDVLAALRDPAIAPARLEDRLVDVLAVAVARATGAGLLVADAPRAMIDLNRAPHDIDWGMVGDAAPSSAPVSSIRRGDRGSVVMSARARGGLGLVPRRLPGVGELWQAPLARADLTARIEGVHQPYHACLADELARVRARWGAVLLLDLHSMPPLPGSPLSASHGLSRDHAGVATARVVLGDRFGTSCAGSLVASAFANLAGANMPAAHNRPYAGGYGLERHGAPTRGIHALQVEIDRSCYLDSRLMELGPGFEAMSALLVTMVRRLAGEVAMLGGAEDGTTPWPLAAE